jgi:hypothetical protein
MAYLGGRLAAGSPAEVVALLHPATRQRPLQLLQQEHLICSPGEDRLHDIGR